MERISLLLIATGLLLVTLLAPPGYAGDIVTKPEQIKVRKGGGVDGGGGNVRLAGLVFVEPGAPVLKPASTEAVEDVMTRIRHLVAINLYSWELALPNSHTDLEGSEFSKDLMKEMGRVLYPAQDRSRIYSNIKNIPIVRATQDYCLDSNGAKTDASFDGQKICYAPAKIARQLESNNVKVPLVALFAHEFYHTMQESQKSENEATWLQRIILQSVDPKFEEIYTERKQALLLGLSAVEEVLKNFETFVKQSGSTDVNTYATTCSNLASEVSKKLNQASEIHWRLGDKGMNFFPMERRKDLIQLDFYFMAAGYVCMNAKFFEAVLPGRIQATLTEFVKPMLERNPGGFTAFHAEMYSSQDPVYKVEFRNQEAFSKAIGVVRLKLQRIKNSLN
jgi:hypothetical protein